MEDKNYCYIKSKDSQTHLKNLAYAQGAGDEHWKNMETLEQICIGKDRRLTGAEADAEDRRGALVRSG